MPKERFVSVDDKHSNDYIFGCGNDDFVAKGFLDKDGLPPVGRVLRQVMWQQWSNFLLSYQNTNSAVKMVYL